MISKKHKSFAHWQFGLWILLITGFVFTPAIYSQSWGDTRLMTTVGDTLHTIESDGAFYRTDLTTGKKTKVGNGHQNEAFLFSDGTNVFSISFSGDFLKHYPTTKLATGSWRNTRLIASDSNYFYTVETDGKLYRTNLLTSAKSRIGNNIWTGAKLILAEDGMIAVIGYPQLYAVNSTTGVMNAAGSSGLLNDIRLGANFYRGDLYSIEASGLHRTTPALVKTKISPGWVGAKFMFTAGPKLYLIQGGIIYQIDLPSGNWLKRFPPANANLASQKPATQDSNIGPPFLATDGLAYKAVDGNTDGNWFNGSVSHTVNSRSTNPWWQVDLEADYSVSEIHIWNRTDCCSKELTNFRIWTRTATGKWEEFSPGLKTYSPGQANPLTFTGNKQARYVRVQIEATNAVLMLAEVEVFGKPIAPASGPTPGATPAPGGGASLAEQALWDTAREIDSEAGYEEYLIKYPQGTYAESARLRMKSKKVVVPTPTPTGSPDSNSEDERFWALVIRADVAKGYQDYLDKFTFGKHRDEATYLLGLKSGTSAKPTPSATPAPTPLPKVSPDDEFWDKIKDSSRAEDFEVYLEAFPNGDHKADAMLTISRLKPKKKDVPPEKDKAEQLIKCTVRVRSTLSIRDYNNVKTGRSLRNGDLVIFMEEERGRIRVAKDQSGPLIPLGWVAAQYLDCDP